MQKNNFNLIHVFSVFFHFSPSLDDILVKIVEGNKVYCENYCIYHDPHFQHMKNVSCRELS